MADASITAPALYLKLDQIVNATTVTDSSGNGCNGTIHGTPVVVPQTQLSGSIAFNGSTDYIEVPDPFGTHNTTFTISLWVQPHVINSGFHGILGKQDTLRKPGLWVGPQNGQLHYFSSDTASTSFADVLDGFFLSTDEWVHVAWVNDGTNYRFYRNGTLFATKPAPAQFYCTTTTGYWIGMIDNAFNGLLANVRIYNQAVGTDIIMRDLETDQMSLAAPALYLKLDQIVNTTTVIDSSGNGLNGTIHGTPVVVPQTQLGGCITFNGSSDYVEIPDPFGIHYYFYYFTLGATQCDQQ
jgi:hypothetical protein